MSHKSSSRIQHQQHASRVAASLDYEDDDDDVWFDHYDGYDDWQLNGASSSKSGSGSSTSSKPQEKRGGGGSCYSAKHTRMRAARLGK
eukprot:CAMPEP_0168753964 /NCGR_PEP_ID=MMETSP0724-20121128/19248_1 /TAXON_ID=265536 /ORGANISM="Amphiprora sp., Strain CCMP467" /LENGTH=87 /DNA_ID=CAMNT_0008802411 /DNA_START=44 /DNA_END=307 /DNA_ORIENTATION=-